MDGGKESGEGLEHLGGKKQGKEIFSLEAVGSDITVLMDWRCLSA